MFYFAALDFGVFGFLFSTYAAASFQADLTNPVRPPIAKYLKRFCQAAVFVLAVLTVIAAITVYAEGIGIFTWKGISVWSVIACFVVLTGFSISTVYMME